MSLDDPHELRLKNLNLFPTEEDIPDEYRLKGPVEQDEYLADGALNVWDGPKKEVFSPVCIEALNGPSRKRIGTFPFPMRLDAFRFGHWWRQKKVTLTKIYLQTSFEATSRNFYPRILFYKHKKLDRYDANLKEKIQ